MTNLTTELHTELQTELSTQSDIVLANELRQHLSNIFTDFAHDVDLSFYDTMGDSVRLQHDMHIMDANQASYSLYLPMHRYMHLAVANVMDNPQVALTADEYCHSSMLRQTSAADTVSSHTTGLFTARQPMEVLSGVDQTFNVHLYMANCAATLVVDPRGHAAPDEIEVYTTGFATAFNLNDSTYVYPQTSPIVRTAPIIAGGSDYAGFCSVTFPSREAGASASRPQTRTVIETTEPFISEPGTQALWQFRVYVRRADGTITETILGMRQPLRAGQLKIVKCGLRNDGAVATDDQTVGVSVTLDWKEGNHHEVPL